MHSSPFGRLVWKEARAQFSLWAALVCGALLLQALVSATQGGHPGGAASVVATIAFVLTACFTVASLALLFAGETEDGTRAWLQQLPIRPGTLIGAKLTFALIAVVLFFAATWGTGSAAAVLSGGSVVDLLRADTGDFQKSILGAFAWGLFFSLVFRRVPHVLLAAAGAEIITVGFADNVVGPLLYGGDARSVTMDGIRIQTYATIIGLVLIVDLVLARRWALAGTANVITAPRRMKPLELPGSERRARTWLRLVSWAARRGTPESRETAVLMWREARAAVPFACAWLVLGFIATDLGRLISVPGQVWYQSPLQVLYLIATPVVCGLMTCLGDQRHEVFHFLGERGVAPARVWGVKQFVWLGLAVVLSLLFVRWDSSAATRLRHNDYNSVGVFMSFIRSLHVPTDLPDRAFDRPEDTALQLHYLWAVCFALYAAAQCASFWIRRTILAFGAMLIAAPILVYWNYLLVIGDVPFWIGIWPLTIALLAATLSSASAWLRGRDSWKLRLTRLAAILLPVGAVATAAAAHRAYSVPATVFAPNVWPVIAAREQRIEHPDPGWSTRWNVVLQNFPMPAYHGSSSRPSIGVAASARNQLLELAKALRTGGHGALNPTVLSPDRPVSVQNLVRYLLEETAFRINPKTQVYESAPLDTQWQGFEAGLLLTRYLADESQTAEQWIESVLARRLLFTRLRMWSHRSDQTPESLQRALTFLLEDLGQPLDPRQMIINRQVFYQQLLDHRGRQWAELTRQLDTRSGVAASMTDAFMPGFERERMLRILSRVTNDSLATGQPAFNPYSTEGEQLRRWAASTPLLPITVVDGLNARDDAGRFAPGSAEGVLQQATIQELGTATIVALQLYHFQHGEFPELLSDALPDPLYWRLTAMDRSFAFTYERRGLPGDLYLPYGLVIPAGQPLLWTPGTGSGRIARTEHAIVDARGSATIPRGAFYQVNREFAPRDGVLGWQTLEPAQVLYLDLTTTEADVLELSVTPPQPRAPSNLDAARPERSI